MYYLTADIWTTVLLFWELLPFLTIHSIHTFDLGLEVLICIVASVNPTAHTVEHLSVS